MITFDLYMFDSAAFSLALTFLVATGLLRVARWVLDLLP